MQLFGIKIDQFLSFKCHVAYVVQRLGKQCGFISNMRHFVARLHFLNYYNSDVKFMLYGVLIYGCCNFSILKPICLLQKKILKFIHSRKRSDTSEDLFRQNGLLTIYELQIYELLKFVLR